MKLFVVWSLCISLAFGQDTLISPDNKGRTYRDSKVPEGVAVPWRVHPSLLGWPQWPARVRHNHRSRQRPTTVSPLRTLSTTPSVPVKKNNLPQCKRSDPNLERCILDGNKALRTITNREAPFRIKELSGDSSMNGVKLHAIHRHIVAHGGSNYRIENFKVDFHNKQKYIGNLTLIYPRLWISAQYQKKGIKMHFDNFHTRGSFKGIFDNVRAELRCVGSPIIKNGVEYLQLDTVTAEVSIENSNLQLKPFDHTKYGQYIADFARDYPYEALQKEGPVINEVSARLFKQYMNEALITMPLKNMLAD